MRDVLISTRDPVVGGSSSPRRAAALAALLCLAAILPGCAADEGDETVGVHQAPTGITFRAASSAQGEVTALTLAKPAGTVQHDVMLAVVTVEKGTDQTITAPAGWTLQLRHDFGTNIAQAVYFKAAGVSEPTSYAWTFSTKGKAAAALATYSGADSAAPIDASGGRTNDAATVTAPSVTTTLPNTLLVGFFGMDKEVTFTPPSGMTERVDVGAGPPKGYSVETADQAIATAGATGTRAATASSNSKNVGQLVALRLPRVAFSGASSSGVEAIGDVALPVTLTGASSADVTVDYAVTGGTAQAGTDHVLAAGALTFAAGETSASIPLQVVDDGVEEPDETVIVALSNPSNAVLGATTTHTYTIVNDDTTGQVSVDPVPVLLDGTPDDSPSWGRWDAQPGAAGVAAQNYLKITNSGTSAVVDAVLDFSEAAFIGALDPNFTIPIDGNIEFAWWEDTTPSSTAPSEGAFVYGEASALGSTVVRFTELGSIVYVHYRLVALPEVLAAQSYAATFTVTEVS